MGGKGGKRDERQIRWHGRRRRSRRRNPRGEMEGREYRLNGKSVLNHFTLSLLGCGLTHILHSMFLSCSLCSLSPAWS